MGLMREVDAGGFGNRFETGSTAGDHFTLEKEKTSSIY
jgi:hypothetical protein